jgi:hypothetical protein
MGLISVQLVEMPPGYMPTGVVMLGYSLRTTGLAVRTSP